MAGSKKAAKVIWAHCNACLHMTNHTVIGARKRGPINDYHEETLISTETTVYEFIECNGCHNVALKSTYSFEPNHGEGPIIEYFPPLVSRPKPPWLNTLEFMWGGARGRIGHLLKEIYSAIYSGNTCIALMGIRAVADIVLTDKLGDIGGFKQKLDEAVAKNWITKMDQEVLCAVIDAGDAASHRGYKPEVDIVKNVLDIVEHLIQRLYVFTKMVKEIKDKTPPRNKVPKLTPPKTN